VQTVIHQGRCPRRSQDSLIDELGPNGRLAQERRRIPGYLGGLLLIGEPVGALLGGPGSEMTDFLVVEMWDERMAGPGISAALSTDLAVDWLSPPAVYVAIR
jgi:hypothetical protein